MNVFESIGRTPPWKETWSPGTGPLSPKEIEQAQLVRLVAKYPDLARSLLPRSAAVSLGDGPTEGAQP